MGSETKKVHVVFFPLLAYGHMIPMLNIAKLFADRNGVTATIITTPLNAPIFSKTIDMWNRCEGSSNTPVNINIEVFKFPTEEAGGCEIFDQAAGDEKIARFYLAMATLREQLEQYLDDVRPTCLVADLVYLWAVDAATKFNIPRIVFQSVGYFAMCAQDVVIRFKPHKNVSSDDEPFLLPSLPHQVKLTRNQLSVLDREDYEIPGQGPISRLHQESMRRSIGIIVNSFYQLEPDYVDFFNNNYNSGTRSWDIGPVSLCNRTSEQGANRVSQKSVSAIDEDECLKWLDSKKPRSVFYICFGSTVHFIAPQIHEIALALESSGQEFIWVVKQNHGGSEEKEWLPLGFEQRTQGKGLILRGWAPQVLILEHQAIASFVTHCGWNSTLESICAGVPMVTWPVFADHFYNEKLVTDILKIGVPVGANKWSMAPLEELIKSDAIEKAIRTITDEEVALDMRCRAQKLKEMARNAIRQGGSSYSQLSSLIDELRDYRA